MPISNARGRTPAAPPIREPLTASQLMGLSVGGAAVAAGGVYLVGTLGAPVLLSSAVLVGAGAAAISAAFTMVSGPAPTATGLTRVSASARLPGGPRRSLSLPSSASPAVGRPHGLAVHFVRTTSLGVSPGPSFSAAARPPPGDRLWATLVPPPTGSLPVELVGPIRESPPDAVEFDPSPYLDQFLVAADLPIHGSAPNAGMGSEMIEVPPGFTGGPAPALPSLVSDWISVEALTPTPPHLRVAPAGPGVDGPPRPRRPTGPSGREDACASCSSPLADLPEWRRCSVCRSPMCLRCTLEVLQSEGRGWCSQCRGQETDASETAAS